MKDVFLEVGNFLSMGLRLGLEPQTPGHGLRLWLAICWTGTWTQVQHSLTRAGSTRDMRDPDSTWIRCISGQNIMTIHLPALLVHHLLAWLIHLAFERRYWKHNNKRVILNSDSRYVGGYHLASWWLDFKSEKICQKTLQPCHHCCRPSVVNSRLTFSDCVFLTILFNIVNFCLTVDLVGNLRTWPL